MWCKQERWKPRIIQRYAFPICRSLRDTCNEFSNLTVWSSLVHLYFPCACTFIKFSLTQPLSSRRRFGTLLSPNSPATRPPGQTKARTYTVTFEAGVQPLGLQLEPFLQTDRNATGCRVQKFSDGGPDQPGPARAKGCIAPGDIVLKVNGHEITGYDQAIALLKQHEQPRVIVLRSVVGVVEEKTKEAETKSISSGTMWSGILSWTAKKADNKSTEPPSLQVETPQEISPITPKSMSMTPVTMERSPFPAMDVSLIQSADDLVLLSQNVASPRMTVMSPNHNNSFVLPVDEMLEQDFGTTVTEPTSTAVGHMRSELANASNSSGAAPQIKVLQKEKKMLQQELQAWKEKFAQAEASHVAYLETLGSEKEAIVQQTKQLETKAKELEAANESERQTWIMEKERLVRDANDYKSQVDRLNRDHVQERQAWNASKNDLLIELEKQRALADNAQSHQSQTESQTLKEAHKNVQDLKKMLTQRQEVVDRLRLERDGAVRTAQQKSQFASELARKFEEERANAKVIHDDLEKRLEKSTTDWQERLDASLAEQAKEIKRLKEERQQFKDSNEVLQRRNVDLSAANEGKTKRLHDKIVSLEKELGHKDAQLKEAAHLMSLMGADLRRAEEKLSSREHSVKFIKEESATAKSRLAAATLEVSELKKSLAEYEAKLHRVTREKSEMVDTECLQQLQTTLEETRQELAEKSTSNESLQTSLHKAEKEIVKQREELDQCRRSISNLQSKCDNLESAAASNKHNDSKYRESLAQELIEAQNELSEANLRNTDLDRVLRSMRRNLSDAERRASTAREQLESERRTSESLKTKVYKVEKDAQVTMDALSNDIRSLREANYQLQEDLRQCELRLSSALKDGERLQHELQITIESYHTKFTRMESERTTMLENSVAQKKEISDLQERLSSARADAEETQRTVRSLHKKQAEEIQRMKQENDSKNEQMKESLSEKDREIRSLSKVREELRILRSEFSLTQHSLQRSREECDFLSKLLDEVREDSTAKIQDANESNKLEMKKVSESKAQIEEQLISARSKLVSSEKQVQELQDSAESSKEEADRLRNENKRLQGEISSLARQLSEKSKELEEVTSNVANDGSDGECDDRFAGFSLQDLRKKCIELSQELEKTCARLSESEAEVADEKIYSKEVSEQCSHLSEEIGMLSGSMERLQTQLTSSNIARADALNDLETTKETVKQLTDLLRAKEKNLSDSQSEITRLESEATELRERLNQLCASSKKESSTLTSELKISRAQLQDAEEKFRLREDELRTLKAERFTQERVVEESQRALEETRSELSVVQTQYEKSREIADSLSKECSELKLKLEILTEEIATADTELKNQLSGSAAKLQHLNEELATKTQQLERYSEELSDSSAKLLTMAAERDEARSSLSQAMQQAKSYKETIKELEREVDKLEEAKQQLTAAIQVANEKLLKLEEESQSSLEISSKQLQKANEKCSEILVERDQALSSLAEVTNELTVARRRVSESETLLQSQQAKVDSLSVSLELANTEAHKLREELEHASVSRQDLTKSLENKQRETDQLKAKVQVLNATVTRIKTEQALLQDSLSQIETKGSAGYDSRDDEILRLRSKLESQEQKLSSLTEVYKSQQQVLSLSQSLEDQLMLFCEGVLNDTGDSLYDMTSYLSEFQRHCKVIFARKDMLDQVGLDLDAASKMESVLLEVTNAIPMTKAMLEERQGQLTAWKKRRSLRVAPTPSCSTPNAKPRGNVASPGVLDALDQMKRVLNDEILTPHKKKSPFQQSFDTEYLQKVVAALESQIDSLLADLQSANEALKAKDQLFSDLEHLVAHHENERDALEEKLRHTTESLELAKQKIKELEKTNSTGRTAESSKIIAGRLIANFVESRNDLKKAEVLRGWASTLGQNASRQRVDALSLELETMREKFMILKKHLKKTRKAKGQVQLQPSLTRILEESTNEQGEEEDNSI